MCKIDYCHCIRVMIITKDRRIGAETKEDGLFGVPRTTFFQKISSYSKCKKWAVDIINK
jgi:hypothetical protein